MNGALPAKSAEDLALEAQGGSVPAFEGLVTRFERSLFRYLHVRTGDEGAAEDLTQEAFLRAWQNLDRYDSRWRFSTWLYTLAQRLAISAHRSRGRDPMPRSSPENLNEIDSGGDPGDEAARRDEGQALWDLAARTLDEEDRSALWLRYAEDLSIEEIARILDKKHVTVRVRLFRARDRLAKAHAAESEQAARRNAQGVAGVITTHVSSSPVRRPEALGRGAGGSS